jgi:O-acetyl-ADP-ribose deacetylase (regulator of RNase III)
VIPFLPASKKRARLRPYFFIISDKMATGIQYIKGDATAPSGEGNKIIVHICNDVGGWGKGFVMAISSRWKQPEQEYRNWYTSKEGFGLGQVQFVKVSQDTWVANVIGQRDIKKNKNGLPPIRYDAVSSGLRKVGEFATQTNASIHMPRIGCGLAGGTWEKIEPLIIQDLSDKGILVTVYDIN